MYAPVGHEDNEMLEAAGDEPEPDEGEDDESNAAPPNVTICFEEPDGEDDDGDFATLTLSLDTYSVQRNAPDLSWHVVRD